MVVHLINSGEIQHGINIYHLMPAVKFLPLAP